jgi:PAS domain S-box-containing protein
MTEVADLHHWPTIRCEMAALIRDRNWSTSTLGTLEVWPQPLRAIVNLMLASNLPMVAFWGPHLIQIFNDAARPLLGRDYLRCLGQPTPARWHEDWELATPVLDRVRAGQAIDFEDKFRPIWRQGSFDPAWFTLSFSPLLNENSEIVGVLLTAIETTRHMVAQNELRASSQRFRQLVTSTSCAVFRMSPDWQDLLQLHAPGFIAETDRPSRGWLQRYVHPDDHSTVLAAIDEAVRTKRIFEIEHRVRRLDRTFGWTLSRAIPVFCPSKQLVEWFGTVTDITDRKNAEALLRDTERRNTFLLGFTDALRRIEDSQELVATASALLGRQINAVQVAYAEIDEWCEHATIAQDWNDGSIPGIAGRHRLTDFGEAFVSDLKNGIHTVVSDVRFDSCTSGMAGLATVRRLSVSAFLNVTLLKRGRLAAIMAVHSRHPRLWTEADISLVHDVAERIWIAVEHQRAEIVLRHSENRFRQFGDASTDILWIRNGQTLEWEYLSPAFEKIFGAICRSVLGAADQSRWAHLIHGDDRAKVFSNLRKVQAGACLNHEYRIHRVPDRDVRWIQSVDFPITSASGEVRHIAGIARDITESKVASERIHTLLTEVDHRTRNLMVVIGSIVKGTPAETDERAHSQNSS